MTKTGISGGLSALELFEGIDPIDADDSGAGAGDDPGAGGDDAGEDGGAGDDPGEGDDGFEGDGDPGEGDDAGDGSGTGDDDDDDGDDSGTVASILTDTGFTPPEGKSYEESYEGLREMVADMTTAAQQAVFADLEESLPDVAEFLQYRLNGGDPAKYFQQISAVADYSKIEITEDNVPVQKQVYRAFLEKNGFTPEEAEEEVLEAEQLNTLQKKAELARTKLVASTAKEVQAEQARLQKAADEAREADRKEWQAIQDTIKTGKLATFEVPQAEKAAFWNWMIKPVDKEGNTARSKATAAMSREQRLALEYLVFKGVDLSKVRLAKPQSGGSGKAPVLPRKAGAGSRLGGGSKGTGSDGRGGSQRAGKLPTLSEILGL